MKSTKSNKGMTFDLKNDSHLNVIVSVEEFANGELIISAKYKEQLIGKIVTSIKAME